MTISTAELSAPEMLCCPFDQAAPLREEARALTCPSCGRRYPLVDGVADFISTAELAGDKRRESGARDEDAPGYDATVPAYQTGIEVEAMLSDLRVAPGEIVIDLGAGTGRVTEALARLPAMVLAIDISPRSLRLNRERTSRVPGARVAHVAADVCRLPVRSGIARKVASGMMLEHVELEEDRRRCLAEIRRVLAPGGRAVLTAYNYSLKRRRRGAARSGFHQGGLYFYRFDRTELAGLLAGFERVKVSAILSLPAGLRSKAVDNALRRVPPLATLSGELLYAVADR